MEGTGASPTQSHADEATAAGARTGRWTAILLAGSRPGNDPLAAHFNVPLKALTPVAGVPMILRVIRNLAKCPSVARVLIVTQRPELLGDLDLSGLPEGFSVERAAGKEGIAESLLALAGTEAAPWPVMVTTADHPLLTSDMVEHFLAQSAGSDVSLAVVGRPLLSAAYPRSRRTWLRFRGGDYTGANLFTASTATSAGALKVLAKAEASRKEQLKFIWHFGPALALGVLTRTMSLEQVVGGAGKKLGIKPAVVVLPFAEAGIDVDSLEDWTFVDRHLSEASPAVAEGAPAA